MGRHFLSDAGDLHGGPRHHRRQPPSPKITGNLASTNEEGTWVVMSYLIANAIVLPISGWLASYLGRKRLRLNCVSGFTLTSLSCGLATTCRS